MQKKIFWAFRLAVLAVGLSAATPQAPANGAHGRGQELPPVALPLPVPQSPRLCGVSAPIPGATTISNEVAEAGSLHK